MRPTAGAVVVGSRVEVNAADGTADEVALHPVTAAATAKPASQPAAIFLRCGAACRLVASSSPSKNSAMSTEYGRRAFFVAAYRGVQPLTDGHGCQNVRVLVRGDHVETLAGGHAVLPADRHRQLDLLAGQLGEPLGERTTRRCPARN